MYILRALIRTPGGPCEHEFNRIAPDLPTAQRLAHRAERILRMQLDPGKAEAVAVRIYQPRPARAPLLRWSLPVRSNIRTSPRPKSVSQAPRLKLRLRSRRGLLDRLVGAIFERVTV